MKHKSLYFGATMVIALAASANQALAYWAWMKLSWDTTGVKQIELGENPSIQLGAAPPPWQSCLGNDGFLAAVGGTLPKTGNVDLYCWRLEAGDAPPKKRALIGKPGALLVSRYITVNDCLNTRGSIHWDTDRYYCYETPLAIKNVRPTTSQ